MALLYIGFSVAPMYTDGQFAKLKTYCRMKYASFSAAGGFLLNTAEKSLLGKVHDLPFIQPLWDFVRAQLRYHYIYGLRLWWSFIVLGGIPKSQRRLDDQNVVDTITISFNNPVVVQHQIRLFRQNLQDPFMLTVFDNSRDSAAQAEIAGICQEQGIQYFTLPQRRRYTRLNPSDSHGRALKWTYRLYLKKHGAAYIGFLDHEIFPTAPVSVTGRLDAIGSYGPVIGSQDPMHNHKGKWFVWPGLCFHSRPLLKGHQINFMPALYLDTGGGNYAPIYKKQSRTTFEMPALNKTSESFYERYGQWLHVIRASGAWKASPPISTRW